MWYAACASYFLVRDSNVWRQMWCTACAFYCFVRDVGATCGVECDVLLVHSIVMCMMVEHRIVSNVVCYLCIHLEVSRCLLWPVSALC